MFRVPPLRSKFYSMIYSIAILVRTLGLKKSMKELDYLPNFWGKVYWDFLDFPKKFWGLGGTWRPHPI